MRGSSAKNSNQVDNQIDEVEKIEEIPEKWFPVIEPLSKA